MKIHIVNDIKDVIIGYEPVLVGELSDKLSMYADNECELMLAGNILDLFPVESHDDLLSLLLSKLRLGGTLVVGGLDMRCFARNVVSEAVSETEASRLIAGKNSAMNCDYWARKLRERKISIDSISTKGMFYEISATRHG